MAGEHILVVDDSPANLKIVGFVLRSRGYEVRLVSDANEAMVALRAERPDAILMDLQLPGIDGLELTRRLKADPETHAITIVALTAYAMKGDEQRAYDAGCDGYIPKPIDTRTFASTVAAFLQRAGHGAAGQ